jgi:hypothetical protein
VYRVILINRDIGTSVGNMPVPVSGRSGKLYGHAFVDADRGGPIFEMTLEAYDQAKFDLIGNPNFRCQWVPCFEEKQVRNFGVPAGSLACQKCGQFFEPKAHNQIFCSYGCRRDYKNAKRRRVTD